MPRRPALVGLIALALTGSLTACAPAPDVDAAYEWANAQFATEHDGINMAVVGANPHAWWDEDADTDQYRFTFEQRADITGLRVRCFGGTTLSIGAEVTAALAVDSFGGDVLCDERDHVIAYDRSAGNDAAISLTLGATAPVSTAALVVVEGAMPVADTWADFFDDLAAQGGYSVQAWGSFGPSDEIVVIENRDRSLPAGEHTVDYTCAGIYSTHTVAFSSVAISGAEMTPVDVLATEEVSCPGTATFMMRNPTDGFAMSIDSHGSAGAYLVQVDPGGSVPAP
jgi:hypothetical protein